MTPPQPQIHAAANVYGLDPAFIDAWILVESGGNPWAWNPEPKYRYLWNVRTREPFRALTPLEGISETPPVDFPCLAGDRDQEWWGQQASWGLLQIMGAVAREHGFREPYLTELCDPYINVSVACRFFRTLLDWADDNTAQALAAYNGGKWLNAHPPYRNQAYATKVLDQHARLLQHGDV
jgi:hypothetical protein